MSLTYLRRAAVALALIATAGCTVKSTEPPPLSGPSGLALLLTLNAIPDSISQDGGSQSSVRVTAIGPDGKPVSAVPIRVDMMVNGVAQDYGTLSARTIVTNGDGVASVVYTAPPSPSNGIFGTCFSLPGTCVSIVATATATNFDTANPQQVQIRLVPPGVILPPASLPTAAFTFSPTAVSAGLPVQFDASTSCGGPLSGGLCTSSSQIVTYSWNFGDSTAGSGKNVTHTFSAGNSFFVTLTVTNDRGLVASASQTLPVATAAVPVASFTVSPQAPAVNQSVFFNASASTPGSGHSTITSYRWTFGDGGTGQGVTVSHQYATAGTYGVQLTVTDETGLSTTSAATSVTVGAGLPTASFSVSPTAPGVNESVFFNGSASTPGSGHLAITSYSWTFGDGGTAQGVTASHKYTTAGTYSVQLTVKDETGLSATSSVTTVTVGAPPTPTAAFTFSPSTPTASQAVVFDGSTSTPSGQGQPITDYAWSFGDGTPIVHTANKTIGHTFGFGGAFSVNLTVTDGAGRVGVTSATITVSNADATLPAVLITATPSPAPVNTEVSFVANPTSLGTGATSIVNYQWDFGDGTQQFSSSAVNVGFTYRVKGTYTVKVTATNNVGRQGSATFTIVVQ
jgi:PKD repeat protein